MKKTMYGLAFLVILTGVIYYFFGFEITIIFLVIDMSVGISYEHMQIIELLRKENLDE